MMLFVGSPFMLAEAPPDPGGGGSGITFVGAASTNIAAGAAATLTLPAGLQEGDYVLVLNSGDSDGLSTTSAGWDELVFAAPSAGFALNRKRMGATPDASIAFGTNTTTDPIVIVALAFRGADATTPLDAAIQTVNYGSSVSTKTPPPITTTTADAMVVYFVTHDDDILAPSDVTGQPGGYTNGVVFDQLGSAGNSVTVFYGYAIKAAAAGAEAPGDITTTQSDEGGGVTIALRAA